MYSKSTEAIRSYPYKLLKLLPHYQAPPQEVFLNSPDIVSKANTDNGAPAFTGASQETHALWCHSRSMPVSIKPVLPPGRIQGRSMFSSHWVRSHPMYVFINGFLPMSFPSLGLLAALHSWRSVTGLEEK